MRGRADSVVVAVAAGAVVASEAVDCDGGCGGGRERGHVSAELVVVQLSVVAVVVAAVVVVADDDGGDG